MALRLINRQLSRDRTSSNVRLRRGEKEHFHDTKQLHKQISRYTDRHADGRALRHRYRLLRDPAGPYGNHYTPLDRGRREAFD
ncbi:hypothetical protein EVAR_8414_1 [Eumeta japonica]|uniref:Uncharacterized protein n=1 Tax=Eumeta variegata TaxID=151549 RepID=A0A4C1WBP6_EUMVA|nr:hypothetical protein EVAR_8414_1 [Eumeta japonica]